MCHDNRDRCPHVATVSTSQPLQPARTLAADGQAVTEEPSRDGQAASILADEHLDSALIGQRQAVTVVHKGPPATARPRGDHPSIMPSPVDPGSGQRADSHGRPVLHGVHLAGRWVRGPRCWSARYGVEATASASPRFRACKHERHLHRSTHRPSLRPFASIHRLRAWTR